MLKYLLIFGFILLVSCTDSNVKMEQNTSTDKIYSVENGAFYLRKVTIEGNVIFFVVNKEGQPIAGASTSFKKGKATAYASTIVGTGENDQ